MVPSGKGGDMTLYTGISVFAHAAIVTIGKTYNFSKRTYKIIKNHPQRGRILVSGMVIILVTALTCMVSFQILHTAFTNDHSTWHILSMMFKR